MSATQELFPVKKLTATGKSEKIYIIPPSRTRYLSEISENIRKYNKDAESQSNIAQRMFGLHLAMEEAKRAKDESIIKPLQDLYRSLEEELSVPNRKIIEGWKEKVQRYKDEFYTFKVRDKEIKIATHTKSLSQLDIPKISLPKYTAWGDILKWNLQENVPGEFPFTAGVYPFKREGEDPTRMFAGEGSPERTNKRFHYVSLGLPAKRLSTAFDSVTLYGEDPDLRPDIYGKIGNAGVSICCLDDMKKLYSGFDLCEPNCSVSMTINGPAPMLAAFFMNAATDQQCEKYIKANGLESEVESKIAS
ncbi:MAG: methylmalonyl-CoA mutase family protein, partial [Chitinophagales bacterium]